MKLEDTPVDAMGRELFETVLKDLVEGCDSCVKYPGTTPTKTANSFDDPVIDIPRIIDALASEVKAGRMAGPLMPGTVKDAKINGFLSIVKPSGARRQVGNLAAPRGVSFNDGIPPEAMKEWPVIQTTAKQFSRMIADAGRGALFSCSDMVAAYKCLPVKKEQRRFQVFSLLGREFVDLRLIFGDKRACLLFDRFHHCVIQNFVLPLSPIPICWLGRTIDDVTTVSPVGAQEQTRHFVATYRSVLEELGIGAAVEDSGKHKAFDGSTEREVLGVWFNSETLS